MARKKVTKATTSNTKPAPITYRAWDTSQNIVPPHDNYSKVVKAFEPRVAALRAQQSIESFGHTPGFVVTDTVNGKMFFRDNGDDCKVLAIAHLDSVQKAVRFQRARTTTSNRLAYISETVDDRLGAYVILDLLPALGVTGYDILLTEGEEIGQSTAMHFEPPAGKQYNWMFSFDREGIDVVMYQYDTQDTRDKVKKVGFKPGIGSFSDICFLDDLECCGFNFGTGYYNNHSKDAYFVKHHLLNQVATFLSFWRKYKEVHMPAPKDKATRYSRYGAYTGWDDSTIDYFGTSSRWDKNKEPYHAFCRICSFRGYDTALIDVKEGEVRHCGKCGTKWYRMWGRVITRLVTEEEALHGKLRCSYCDTKLALHKEEWQNRTLTEFPYNNNYHCNTCGARFYLFEVKNTGYMRLISYGKEAIDLDKAYTAEDDKLTEWVEGRATETIDEVTGKQIKYKTCDMCNTVFPSFDLLEIQGGWELCEECLDIYCNYCTKCHTYYMAHSETSTCGNCHKSAAITLSSNNQPKSLDSFADLISRCYVCLRTEQEAGNFTWTVAGKYKLCQDCAEQHIKECASCGKPFYFTNSHTSVEETYICSDCRSTVRLTGK